MHLPFEAWSCLKGSRLELEGFWQPSGLPRSSTEENQKVVLRIATYKSLRENFKCLFARLLACIPEYSENPSAAYNSYASLQYLELSFHRH